MDKSLAVQTTAEGQTQASLAGMEEEGREGKGERGEGGKERD